MLAILIVAIVIIGSVVIMTNDQHVNKDRIELDMTGLHEGDQFVYSVDGMFNDRPVNGTITAKYIASSGFGNNGTFSDPEFGSSFWNHSSFSIFGQGTQVGTGMYATPFGPKGVVWTFSTAGSWATVTFVGPRPGIAYGSAINGPNVHLITALIDTTSQWVMVNNTAPLTIQPKPFQNAYDEGGLGGIDAHGSSSGETIYTENGGHMNYSIEAKDVDVISYSEGNIRSMAEGGPYAYDTNLFILHSGNATGDLEIPKGFFYVVFFGHNPTTEPSSGVFSWKITYY